MTVGFFIYINYFANFTEIYGAISAVVIFLMWLYIIMKGLISGMNLNVYYLGKRKKSRRQYALKRQLIKLN
jgi:membrane protein